MASSANHTPTFTAVRWLMRISLNLTPGLLAASVLACLTKIFSLAIFVVAGLGVIKAAGLPAPPPLPETRWIWLITAIILLGLLKGASRYAEQFLGHKVAFTALARLRNRVYQAAEAQAPLEAQRRQSGGLLAVATRDVDRIEVFFAHTLPPAVAALVLSILSVWGTYTIGGAPAALIFLIGYVMVGVLVPSFGVRSLRRAAQVSAKVRAEQNQLLTETLAGIDVVHGYSAAQRVMQQFNDVGQGTEDSAQRAGDVNGVRSALSQMTVFSTLIALAVLLVPEGRAAELILLGAAAVPSYDAVRAVDGFIIGLQDSFASAVRLYRVCHGVPQVGEPADPVELPAVGVLSATGLSVAYRGERVLHELAFELPPGRMMALVGDSGSGKSSAAAAIVRAVPSVGRCSFGGVDTARVSLAALRERIILLEQNAVLVRGTVRENLLLGAEGVEDRALVEVLEELGLDGWLGSLSQGLDTPLGGPGIRLSGGQRQRLALARALLRAPAVLILDESTSALDAHSEKLVHRALAARRQSGMSMLMITHRLSNLSAAAQVIVLRDGHVVERGAPGALLADADSEFSRMAVREADRIQQDT